MKVYILCLLVVTAWAVEFDSSLDDIWTMYKARSHKAYDGEEEMLRFVALILL